MPETTTAPVFSFAYAPDGSFSGTVPPAMISAAGTHAGAVNWAALLQAILAAMPAIIAIINAFTGGGTPPAPVPTPSPLPGH